MGKPHAQLFTPNPLEDTVFKAKSNRKTPNAPVTGGAGKLIIKALAVGKTYPRTLAKVGNAKYLGAPDRRVPMPILAPTEGQSSLNAPTGLGAGNNDQRPSTPQYDGRDRRRSGLADRRKAA